jgi:hypothetical protein
MAKDFLSVSLTQFSETIQGVSLSSVRLPVHPKVAAASAPFHAFAIPACHKKTGSNNGEQQNEQENNDKEAKHHKRECIWHYQADEVLIVDTLGLRNLRSVCV